MLEHSAKSSTEEFPFDSEQANALVGELRRTFRSGRTRGVEWRKKQLRAMRAMLQEREGVFEDALRRDLGKPPFESWLGELGFLGTDIDHVLKHLDEWLEPEKVRTPLVNQPGKSYVVSEPLGVTLIIAPWNYPVQLALSPLVGAIAGGNCAVVKPSEMAPHVSAAIAEWIPKYMDGDCIRVVQGAVAETQALLEQPWDHIFYTGNGSVGRIVMEAAAKHLTPVTLELGGKSPAIVDRDVDLDVAAHRIVWGKFFNAGQTCVAPDYLLVDEAIEQPLLDRMRETIRDFYGDDPKESPDYGRIINDRHFQRLASMIDEGDVILGGQTDRESRYIAPTVVENASEDSKLMQDEIFGPILPVVRVSNTEMAIEKVNARPKPLALYVFSKNRNVISDVLEQTSSGGACVNDAIVHLSVPELPFGGVGNSGMGSYHGRASFDTFTHKKSVLDKSTKVDPALRYPPYDERKQKWAKRLV